MVCLGTPPTRRLGKADLGSPGCKRSYVLIAQLYAGESPALPANQIVCFGCIHVDIARSMVSLTGRNTAMQKAGRTNILGGLVHRFWYYFSIETLAIRRNQRYRTSYFSAPTTSQETPA
jgi:hypothetical protein